MPTGKAEGVWFVTKKEVGAGPPRCCRTVPLLGKESGVPHGILLGDTEVPWGFMSLVTRIKALPRMESEWTLVPVSDPLCR